MRVGFLSAILIIFVTLDGSTQRASAMQITSVQLSENQTQEQTQQGLPPDKKRSLSRYGPEDIFPEQGGVDQSRPRRASRPAPASKLSKLSPAPQQLPSTNVTPTAISPPQPAAAVPSPTIIFAALDNQGRQTAIASQAPSVRVVPKWTAPILSALALLVSAALIFVLNKLMRHIKMAKNVTLR